MNKEALEQAAKVLQIFEMVAKDLKLKGRSFDSDPVGDEFYLGRNISSGRNPRLAKAIQSQGKPLGWFGYEYGKPSVWFYEIKSKGQKQLEAKLTKVKDCTLQYDRDNGDIGVSRSKDTETGDQDETGDQEWFISVIKAAGGK